MRIGKRTQAVLGSALLALTGYATYRVVLHYRASHHYLAAQEALARRDLAQAMFHLRNSLSAQPNSLAARFLAAQTARRLGDLQEAERHLKLFKRQNGSKALHDLETKLLHVHHDGFALASGLFADCADNLTAPETPLILEAVLESSFDHMKPWSTGKIAHAGADAPHLLRVKQALELWGQLRHNDAEAVQGAVWRGRLHLYAGELAKAAAAFHEALKLDPSHYQARYHLALATVVVNPSLAVAHLEELRRQDPEDYTVLFSLATIRRSLGQLKEAREALDEIISAASDSNKVAASQGAFRKVAARAASLEASSLLERGLVELDGSNFEESERWLQRALAKVPEAAEIHLALSRCHRLAGREAEANRHQAEFDRLDAQQKRP